MSIREELREIVADVLVNELLPRLLEAIGTRAPAGAELAVSTTEAGRRLGVSQDTVRNWIASGDLPASRTPDGRQFLIQVPDLVEFLKRNSTRSNSGPTPGGGGNTTAKAEADRILSSLGASKR